MPLGNGFSELDPLGIGKGAAPDCVVKGPFGNEVGGGGGGDGGGVPDSEPPVGWVSELPAPPAVVVEVTVTVT